MQVFLSVLFLLFIGLTLFDFVKAPIEIKTPVWMLMLILLVTAAAFRTGENTDTGLYYQIFDEAPYRSEKNKTETGFFYINYFFKLLGFNRYSFLAVFALISVSVMFRFFRRYTPFILVATLIYFSHVFLLREMLQIRAGLAIGIAMFAIPYIHRRSLLKTSVILLIAANIHTSALFFFLLYLVYPFFQSVSSYLILLAVAILIGSFLDMNFFIGLSERVGIYRLAIYVVDGRFTKGLGLLNPVLIKHLLVLFVLFTNYDLLSEKIPYFKVLILSYVMAASWLAAFNSFDILAGRVATLFSNVEHVLIPSFLLIPKKKFLYYLIIIMYCVVTFVSNLKGVVALYRFDASWILP